MTIKNELEQRIADTIIRLHYCKTHWYYPWCAWWLIKAKYIHPLTQKLIRNFLGAEEVDRYTSQQLRSMQWTLKK